MIKTAYFLYFQLAQRVAYAGSLQQHGVFGGFAGLTRLTWSERIYLA